MIYHLNGYTQYQMNFMDDINIKIWVCTCPEYLRPKPCTPSFCEHTDMIMDRENLIAHNNQGNQLEMFHSIF